ncbi:MAG: glycoside hydrolase family 15 protein [Chthoniobacterales bacterium]|nr:glycoside hydrolase family 15 protein [Chthoniobacterales bacterium]
MNKRHTNIKSARIEDYAFLSDTQSGALVSRNGSVDWLCLPRFDSGACFAALLGGKENGCWHFTPKGKTKKCSRRYQGDTLILETEVQTADGTVRFIDFMPPRGTNPDIIRIIEGVEGKVTLRMELIIRFDYGSVVPWVRRRHGGLEAIAGPDALILRTPVETHGEDLKTVAEFKVTKGDRIPFVLTWYPSHESPPKPVRAESALSDTKSYWREWSRRFERAGPWQDAVMRSLLTLKGLTYAPTGGIVAAATTSLPEQIGGVRNWDYRFCWLRDATFTLFALLGAGYQDEARAWREWLLRAIAGSPSQVQIMYGVSGERRLEERELPWLSGYENSQPVRVGNAAAGQFQLDVFGEVLDAIYQAHRSGLESSDADWRLQAALLHFLETRWEKPDEGIWEVRGPRRPFTHSKVMAWVAFDRAVKLVEDCQCDSDGSLERWRKLRDKIHRQVCTRGFNKKKNAFTQFYGSDAMDASVLMLPLVGFLPPNDKRIRGTIEAVERELLQDGFVLRYRPNEKKVDGLPGSEGVFLPCSFWLADCLHLIGRKGDARMLFERLLALRNDVGLLAEEYDPKKKRFLGNFPQAFSHVGLVNSAQTLSERPGAAADQRAS